MLSPGLWAPVTWCTKAFLNLSDLEWLEEGRAVVTFSTRLTRWLCLQQEWGAGQSDKTHPAALRLSYSMVGSALEAPPLPSLLTPSLPPLSFLPFWSHALSFPSLLHPAFLFRILVHMWIPPLVHACGLLPPPESSPWAITMPLICSIKVGWIGVQVSTIWGLWKKQVGQWGAFIQG